VSDTWRGEFLSNNNIAFVLQVERTRALPTSQGISLTLVFERPEARVYRVDAEGREGHAEAKTNGYEKVDFNDKTGMILDHLRSSTVSTPTRLAFSEKAYSLYIMTNTALFGPW
jgi:hypothetical protein